MYNVALGDALHVFGPFGIHLDYTVRLKLRLRDRIDAEALKEAATPAPAQFLRVKVPLQVFTVKCSKPQASVSNDGRGGRCSEQVISLTNRIKLHRIIKNQL